MLIDSHAHLEMKEFDADRDDVISRARSEGVDFIVTVGTNLRLSSRAVALAEQYENIFATVGIHPHDVAKAGEDTLEALKQLVQSHKKIVAYGEIGLDYFRNISRQEIQVEMFGRQLDLVKELNLPVVIHDREAHRQSLDMIQASGVRRGVFHCFSGDYDMARKCIDLGFYISIPGVVTFDKSGKIRDVVERVPLTSLLLETDAPYLTPVPNRGKRNEPAFIVHTAKAVAAIKKISWEDVAAQTSVNTINLFGLKMIRNV